MLVGLAAGCLFAFQAQAQSRNYNVEETQTNVAYYQFAQPGQATIQVSMWGTVPRPGIYEVRENIDIDKLLTMAGGAPIQARRGNETAQITVRLFRDQANGERKKVYEASLKELLRNTGAYPTMQDEDVLVVETHLDEGFDWLNVLSIVGSVASVTLTIDRLLPGGIFGN